MVPKLVSSETVFDAVKLAVSFAPVPGLEAGVVVVEMVRLLEAMPLDRRKD